ncbi:Bacterial sec-independent translocation protein [Perilla frutescens var. hirtella]|uniref:Bacterial sec-independent translocation protein n=1 Tax=Perilla frutescens var. hirtella TaxID=608512 RepID=A0AAD4PDF1_PERFH|nr:Bacterial sec-independent translocation protein [Perilla frutescens var. hirtella]
MSIAIFTPTPSRLHSSSSSSGGKISSLCSFSNSAISIPKNAIFQHIKCVPQLGFTPFSQWSGLKNMGVSISKYSVKTERKGKCKGKGVYASLFGVGAPEVLVIGVVALLVFGPKGLAEVARNLGKTLRAFQPTIRELQEVSREFKSTLEREIGLDDIDNPVPKSPSSNTTKPMPDTNLKPNGSSSETGEASTDDPLKLRADRFRGALAQLQKEQSEERQKEEEEQLQDQVESQTTSEDTSEAPDTPEEASSVPPPMENSQSNALQEAAAVAPTGSASNTEAQS